MYEKLMNLRKHSTFVHQIKQQHPLVNSKVSDSTLNPDLVLFTVIIPT